MLKSASHNIRHLDSKDTTQQRSCLTRFPKPRKHVIIRYLAHHDHSYFWHIGDSAKSYHSIYHHSQSPAMTSCIVIDVFQTPFVPLLLLSTCRFLVPCVPYCFCFRFWISPPFVAIFFASLLLFECNIFYRYTRDHQSTRQRDHSIQQFQFHLFCTQHSTILLQCYTRKLQQQFDNWRAQTRR